MPPLLEVKQLCTPQPARGFPPCHWNRSPGSTQTQTTTATPTQRQLQPQPHLAGGPSCPGRPQCCVDTGGLMPAVGSFPAAQGEEKLVPGHTDVVAGPALRPHRLHSVFLSVPAQDPLCPTCTWFPVSEQRHQPPVSFLSTVCFSPDVQ